MATVQTVEDLRGEHLSEVAFVMDYIQLRFDGPTLNVFASPITTVGQRSFRFPEPGSRDASCSLITLVLKDVVVVPDYHIILSFESGRIEVPLDAERRGKWEAAEFWSDGEMLMDY